MCIYPSVFHFYWPYEDDLHHDGERAVFEERGPLPVLGTTILGSHPLDFFSE